MRAFVVLGLVFHTKPRDWLGEHFRYDLFCVEWDVKAQLNESISLNCLRMSSMCYCEWPVDSAVIRRRLNTISSGWLRCKTAVRLRAVCLMTARRRQSPTLPRGCLRQSHIITPASLHSRSFSASQWYAVSLKMIPVTCSHNLGKRCLVVLFRIMATTTTTVLRPFVRDYLGEPVQEESFTHSPILTMVQPLWASFIYYDP